MSQIYPESDSIAPPPRALKWLVWLLIIFTVLAIVGAGVGVYAFREWVPPRYQFTYSERFPILQVLLPERPSADTTLPTPVAPQSEVDLDALLGLTAEENALTETAPTEQSPTEAPTVEGEAAAPASDAVVSLPTTTSTTIPPTATTAPTATPIPPTVAAVEQANTLSADEIAVLNAPRPPASHRNFGFQYVTQTWNNCGPANVTMSLSYYGWQEPQTYAESFLRGAREDKNVSPNEIVDFVNEQTGVRATYRIGGDAVTLKRLIAAGFPVMVELGYAPEGNDWLGHYQTVVGYDDTIQSFYVLDSYIPSDQGLPETYLNFDRNWQQFNRTLIAFYPQEREGEVMSILGPLADPANAYQIALETAQQEARENPTNGYAWFNIGKAQTRLGNFDAAATAFDQARVQGIPWRMLWYQFEPFEAYYETGRYSDVMALVESNEALLGGGFVEETYYWAGRVYEAQGETAQAAAAYRRALSQNSRYTDAREALERVS